MPPIVHYKRLFAGSHIADAPSLKLLIASHIPTPVPQDLIILADSTLGIIITYSIDHTDPDAASLYATRFLEGDPPL